MFQSVTQSMCTWHAGETGNNSHETADGLQSHSLFDSGKQVKPCRRRKHVWRWKTFLPDFSDFYPKQDLYDHIKILPDFSQSCTVWLRNHTPCTLISCRYERNTLSVSTFTKSENSLQSNTAGAHRAPMYMKFDVGEC